MFCFSLIHMQCSLLFVFWVPLLMKHVEQTTLLRYLWLCCKWSTICRTSKAAFQEKDVVGTEEIKSLNVQCINKYFCKYVFLVSNPIFLMYLLFHGETGGPSFLICVMFRFFILYQLCACFIDSHGTRDCTALSYLRLEQEISKVSPLKSWVWKSAFTAGSLLSNFNFTC